MTIEEKAKAYDKALERARIWKDKSGMPKDKQGILDDIFPELKESEDERIRKELLEHCINRRDGKQVCVDASDYRRWADWLEKQTPVYKEEVLKGARRGVALSIMDFIEANTQGMCMSNIECKNLKDAVINSDWAKVYAFMKLKLDKQGKQKPKGITAWIARDKSGEVLLYEERPVKLKNDPIWESPDGGALGIKELPEGINPKWEDEEATEVELIIKKKKND